MLIQSLKVRHFRNLSSIETSFTPGLNLIVGQNAQGKTNLLEAIYLLVTGRSFRTTNEVELVPWERSDYVGTMVRADIRKASGAEQLGFYFDGKNKQVIVDGTPIQRLTHLVGRLNAVLFTPADLLLVRGAPSLRRRFLDIAIGQTNRLYLETLQQYQQVLRNRNTMLKLAAREMSQAQAVQLDVYDEQLATTGAQIILERRRSLDEISHSAAEHYHRIAGGSEQLRLVYEPDVSPEGEQPQPETALNFQRILQKSRADDLRRLSTGRGPHRDDFHFEISGHAARQFASQGQQRSAVLALKFAEMDYLLAHTGERPLLLLDDVISELDDQRRAALLESLDPEVQTFITTTDVVSLEQVKADMLVLKMRGGEILSEPSE